MNSEENKTTLLSREEVEEIKEMARQQMKTLTEAFEKYVSEDFDRFLASVRYAKVLDGLTEPADREVVKRGTALEAVNIFTKGYLAPYNKAGGILS